MPTYTFNLDVPDCCGLDATVRLPLSNLFSEDKISNLNYEKDEKNDGLVTLELADDPTFTDDDISTEITKILGCKNFKLVKSRKKGSAGFLSKASDWLKTWFKGLAGILSGAALLILFLCNPYLLLLILDLPILTKVAIAAASSSLTWYLGHEDYRTAIKDFSENRKLGMEALFSISSFSILASSVTALFVPGLPMMFDAGLMTFGFSHVGKKIKASIKEKIAKEISLLHYIPKHIDSVSTRELKPGDTLTLKAKQIIPADCIAQENIWVTNKINTGEDKPYLIEKGQILLQGMEVVAGYSLQQKMHIMDPNKLPIKAIVKNSFQTSYLAQRDANMSAALTSNAPIVTSSEKALSYFVPLVVLLAIVSAICISVFLHSSSLAIRFAVMVLSAACPCTLGAIVPQAMKIGMAKAAENGAEFKTGKALQNAAQVNTVVLDLNGTITKGKASVTNFYLDEGVDKKEVFHSLKVLERDASHPCGKAIYQYCLNAENDLELKEEKLPEVIHARCGSKTTVHNQSYIVGNHDMMTSNGFTHADIEKFLKLIPSEKTPKKTEDIIFLACAGKLISIITLEFQIRPEAREVITELKNSGKDVHICTGSTHSKALGYAHELGISPNNVKGGCTPSNGKNSKTAYLTELKTKNPQCVTAMVGDGINDLDAMKTADLSVGLQSNIAAKEVSSHASTVIKGSLRPLIPMFRAATGTTSHIKKNLGFSLAYNMTAMAVTGALLILLGLAINPVFGVLLMILQSSLIYAHSLYFKRQPIEFPNPLNKKPSNETDPEVKTNCAITVLKKSNPAPPTPRPAASKSSHEKSMQHNRLRFWNQPTAGKKPTNSSPSSQIISSLTARPQCSPK